MRLKVVNLKLEWDNQKSPMELRLWLLDHLKLHGDPLRWAITEIESPINRDGDFSSQLKVEAVVVIS